MNLLKHARVVISPLRIPITRTTHLPKDYKKLLYSNATVKLSLLRTQPIRNQTKSFRGRYPSINKCNSRKCICCKYLKTNSFVKSSVNNRNFSIKTTDNIDWNSKNIIYVLTWHAPLCGAQYVGQTGRSLKTRFREHFYKMKTRNKCNSFIYQHFKNTNHDINFISVQPIEHLKFNNDVTAHYETKARCISEMDWIKSLQTAYPLGLNDNMYQAGNISKDSAINAFKYINKRTRNKRSHGKRINGNIRRKNKKILSLLDCFKILQTGGKHKLLSALCFLSVATLRKSKMNVIKCSYKQIRYMNVF